MKVDTHVVVRTNPVGQPMVGRCPNCGATGLRAEDALKPCPNPSGRTAAQNVLSVITGDFGEH